LIQHGENDPRVPVAESRQIAAALRARGIPVELLIFPDEGHAITKLTNQLAFGKAIIDFLS
jgi:dipeptidyl aminopeptidase/acylaminoacyl peptidase